MFAHIAILVNFTLHFEGRYQSIPVMLVVTGERETVNCRSLI